MYLLSTITWNQLTTFNLDCFQKPNLQYSGKYIQTQFNLTEEQEYIIC